MKLKLVRDALSPTTTLGKLYVNGVFECHTLEDCDRKLESGGLKIAKETAIPRGTYSVAITFSSRFQKELLHVLEVPQFMGIRIHPGNSDADTEGCILLGAERSGTRVWNSRLAVDRLFRKVDDELEAGGHCTLEIV
jgi:hypothetical protein